MADPTEARALVERLGMQPHPEGGRFVETYRAPCAEGERSAVSLIYFLLQAGEASRWHRVDAVEVWHWYAGAPLLLTVSEDGRTARPRQLGSDFAAGQQAHLVVPKGAWQTAESLGAYTLVGCTVSPAFDFAGFEMAPEGWRPGA